MASLLCSEELAKLLGTLRCTDRYSDLSKNVPDPELSKIISLQASPSSDPLVIAAPFLQVVLDPALSGFVTSAALSSLIRFCQQGPVDIFLHNPQFAGAVIDAVTKTKYIETDRDADETVLIRIVRIVQLVLTSPVVLDKSRVALGLQCVQTIWIADSHTKALSDVAREAVSAILLHVIRQGCDGYATTLIENICLNIELLSRQPPATFDTDKLAFFLDILASLAKETGRDEFVSYQVVHAMHHLVAPGPLAASVDNSSTGALTRVSQALPLVSTLVALANAYIRTKVPFTLEALVTAVYVRPLAPAESTAKLVGAGEVALALLAAPTGPKKPIGPYVAVLPPAGQPLPQLQVLLLESLIPLLREGLGLTLWESFDCAWHRSELGSLLVDSLLNCALGNRVVALAPDALSVDAAVRAFHQLAASPEAHLDRESLIPTYTECLAMEALLVLLSAPVSLEESLSDTAPAQFLLRDASKELGKQIRGKPKKMAELVLKFLHDYEKDIGHVDGAKALRQIGTIDFDALGEFFGQPSSMDHLSAFIKSLNLAPMDPEEALRACLQSFRLPGEAQQIDRIVKEIAYEYYASHSDLSVPGNYFASADAAYTFLFSIIMLNTDQHNPQVKRRMELKDFVRNNRKINEGEDIPEEAQARIFASIRNSQIATPKSSSLFCCPLRGRWKDLYYLCQTGYIPLKLRGPGPHSIPRFLASKGTDILVAAAFILAQDPHSHTCASAVLGQLAKLAPLDPVPLSILNRYARESFATAISNIIPSNRSFECLHTVLGLGGHASCASLLCYYAPYSLLLESDLLDWSPALASILALPVLDLVAPAGGLTSLFRGLLNPLYETELPVDDLSLVLDNESDVSRRDSAEGLEALDWRTLCVRSSFTASNAPGSPQMDALRAVQIESTVKTWGQEECSRVVVKMFELLSVTTSEDDFWTKELARSSPWSLLLATRLVTSAEPETLRLSAAAAREAVLVILRQYTAGTLVDVRGLKVLVFCGFALATKFTLLDPESLLVDPVWLLPILDQLLLAATTTASLQLSSLSPVVCMSIRTMLMEAPSDRLGAPVWREMMRLVAAVCPKQAGGPTDMARRVCHETALIVLLNGSCLAALGNAVSGANDMAECVIAYESIVEGGAKSLCDLACKLVGIRDAQCAGMAWTAIVARIMTRVTTITRNKKSKGPELSDCVELLRMCLGDPRAYQILTPAQAGTTVEKCASALSGIVAASTPPGALQAALSVFARFFLTCLDKLQMHPQFDHLWLMSLRVILLFIKRGHDGLDQLAEVTTETLRNMLQVLLTVGLIKFPNENPEGIVWWKVTWEIVETFCPGMIDSLTEQMASPKDGNSDMHDHPSPKSAPRTGHASPTGQASPKSTPQVGHVIPTGQASPKSAPQTGHASPTVQASSKSTPPVSLSNPKTAPQVASPTGQASSKSTPKASYAEANINGLDESRSI